MDSNLRQKQEHKGMKIKPSSSGQYLKKEHLNVCVFQFHILSAVLMFISRF